MLKRGAIDRKIIATILIFCFAFMNYFTLFSTISFADDNELGKQKSSRSSANVEYDVKFFQNNEEKGYEYEGGINEENLSIHIKTEVKNEGYLRNAKILIESENGLSFDILAESGDKYQIKDNQIDLSNIAAGEMSEIVLPIKYKEREDIENLNKKINARLVGVYVDKDGNEKGISENIILRLVWKTNTQFELESNIEKYIPYVNENQKGIIIQTSIKANMPINNSFVEKEELQIEALQIEDYKIEKVSVVRKSGEELSQDNWKFDEENNKVEIKLEDSKSLKSEEFLITYIFSGEKELQMPLKLNSNINGTIFMFGNNETSAAQLNAEYDITEKIGEIVTFEAISTESVKVGNLISNKFNSENNYPVNYETKIVSNISSADLVDGIMITENSDEFEKEEVKVPTNSLNKSIRVNKDNFEKILGQDGTIQILNSNGEVVAELNSNMLVDDNYAITFENGLDTLTIKTTAPKTDGNLMINIEKEIINTDYTVDEIKTFSNIDLKYTGSILYEENIENKVLEMESKIQLEKPQTKADITLSRNTLSTIAENNDIELTIKLNNTNEEVDLYQNPSFSLVFPEYIEDVEVSNIALANNEDVFIIKDANINKNEEGKIVLNIELEGTQSKYNANHLANGTNLIVKANMKLNIYTPMKQDSIEMIYANQNATSYANTINGMGYAEAKIEYKAPVGMVSVNKISNYGQEGKSIVSVEQGKITDKIDIYSDAKIATMEILVMNNNENNCSDIKILGRIPFKGNKDVKTGKDLGTTVDTTLASGIIAAQENLANATVYYSTNGEATEKLDDEKNGWTTEINNLSEVKSYLIVVNDYEIKPGDVLRYSYQYRIPENLEHNNNIYGSFETIYSNLKDVATTTEISAPDLVGLTTGVGPQLSVTVLPNIKDTAKEYEKIKYTIELENKGTDIAEDVKVNVAIPKGSTLATHQTQSTVEASKGWTLKADKEFTKTIKSINPGEKQTIEFFVQVNKLPTIEEFYASKEGFTKNSDGTYSIHESYTDENGETKYKDTQVSEIPEINLVCEATITAKDLQKELKVKDEGIVVEKSNLIAEESISAEENIVKVNEKIESKIEIKNNSDSTMRNIRIEKVLPEGLEYVDSYIRGYDEDGITIKKIETEGYDYASRKIVWEIESLEPGRTTFAIAELTVGEMKENVYKDTISTISTISVGGEEYQSGQVDIVIGRPNLQIEQKVLQTNKYVKVGDEIEYLFNIKNAGPVRANDVVLKDLLPKELQIRKLEYIVDGVEVSKVVTSNEDATIYTNIQPENEMVAKVTAKVKDISDEQKTITNIAELNAENIETIRSNEIENVIERTVNANNTNSNENEENTENQNGNQESNTNNAPVKTKYEITGTAWIDDNKNGSRDNGETKLSGVEVKIVNASTGEQIQTETTALDGSYEFKNLENGQYIVIFYYNSSKYGLTDYKKTGVEDNKNSDVISANEGNKIVATTDIITINNGSVSSVDIGVVEATKFDLSLEKSITKITVQNNDGTKTYNFDNQKLAKVDINAKYLSNAKVYVEYSFKIKNEGEVEGYAKNIVDYMPSELEFSTELNKNWYRGNDGNLYTEELSNAPIAAGEEKTVKLTLVKTMTEENTGIINNQAEIAESYNKAGIADTDSEANNKDQKEDDMSSADLIIGVKTGDTLIYLSAILTITVAMIILAVIIKKKKILLKLKVKFGKEV